MRRCAHRARRAPHRARAARRGCRTDGNRGNHAASLPGRSAVRQCRFAPGRTRLEVDPRQHTVAISTSIGHNRTAQRLATSACLARTASAASFSPASSDAVRSRSTIFLHAARADLGLDAQVDAADAVLAVDPGAYRDRLARVLDDRAGHPRGGGRRREVGRPGLEQCDDLGATVAGAGDEFLDLARRPGRPRAACRRRSRRWAPAPSCRRATRG